MASHSEITVGSKDWVVRLDGKDTPVVVKEKRKKASGRGYEFVVQRVGPDGRGFGRKLTRGSGALRRPGTKVKSFGGKTPFKKKAGPKKKAAKKKSAAKNPVSAPKKATKKRSSRSSATTTGYSPPQLGSLRGRSSSRPAAKKAAPKKKSSSRDGGFRVNPKSEKAKKIIRALERLPESARDDQIHSCVANVLAQYNVTAWGF